MSGLKDKNISAFYLVASIVCWIITAMWIVWIFKLSSETGEMSNERSSSFINLINNLLNIDIDDETLIRKFAHILEYSFLALMTFISIRFTNKVSPSTSYAESHVKIIKSDNEMYIALSLWFSVMIAVFDEYYQLFISGRSGSIIDVCIDLIGICFVLLIVRICFTIYLKQIGKEEYRYDQE